MARIKEYKNKKRETKKKSIKTFLPRFSFFLSSPPRRLYLSAAGIIDCIKFLRLQFIQKFRGGKPDAPLLPFRPRRLEAAWRAAYEAAVFHVEPADQRRAKRLRHRDGGFLRYRVGRAEIGGDDDRSIGRLGGLSLVPIRTKSVDGGHQSQRIHSVSHSLVRLDRHAGQGAGGQKPLCRVSASRFPNRFNDGLCR